MSTVQLNLVAGFIDRLLNTANVSDREGNGLALKSSETVSKIGAALNTSFESIRKAADAGADLLLVHHTSWESIDLHLKADKFDRLRKAGISLYAAHETLDRSPEFSSADVVAGRLGLESVSRFRDGGIVGQVRGGSFGDLVYRLTDLLGVPVESWENASECRQIAILPGGAGETSFLHEALAQGCDTYITGEGSMYTKLFAKEAGINLVFGSHYATEYPGILALGKRVSDEFGLPWDAIPEDERVR